MELLFCIGVVIVVAIQIQQAKAQKKRMDEAIDWIVNVDKRWYTKSSEADCYNRYGADDRIVIDLQPDGYEVREHDGEVIIDDLHTDGSIVVDENKGHKERFDW